MSPSANVTVLFDARARAWRDRDPVALAASHTHDGVVQSPIFGRIVGHEAIEQSYRDLFTRFADWTLEGEAPIVEGPRVAQVFSVHATHTSELFGFAATGKKFQIHGVLVFDIAGGRIRHERRLYDFTGMLLQLGVIKARPV